MKHLPVGNPRQFFATSPVACPYLAGGVERKLVVRLEDPESASLFADLSRAGFRRSHAFAYRPAFRCCRMCVPVRFAVARFAPTRPFRAVSRPQSATSALTGA